MQESVRTYISYVRYAVPSSGLLRLSWGRQTWVIMLWLASTHISHATTTTRKEKSLRAKLHFDHYRKRHKLSNCQTPQQPAQWYTTATAASQLLHEDHSKMASAFRRASKKTTSSALSLTPTGSSSTPNNNAVSSSQQDDVHSTATAATTTTSASSSLLGLQGVKPWAGGIHLTSVGLNDLDMILGGGQPLGTCILVQEDRITRDLALSLVRYWCAEAVSQTQHLVIPVSQDEELDLMSSLSSYSTTVNNNDDDEEEKEDKEQQQDDDDVVSKVEMEQFLQSLPRNLHWDKERLKEEKKQRQQKQQEEQSQNQTSSTKEVGETTNNLLLSKELNVLTEEDENEEEEDDDPDAFLHDKVEAEAALEIAWQYRTSVQQERLAQTTTPLSSTSSSSSSSSSSSKVSSSKSRNVYCHSYDLSGRMHEQLQQQQEQSPPVMDTTTSSSSSMDPFFFASVHIATVRCCCQEQHPGGNIRRRHHNTGKCGIGLFRSLLKLIQEQRMKDNNKVIRLLLYHPPHLGQLSVALPLLLSHIRQYQWPVVILICIPPPPMMGGGGGGGGEDATRIRTMLHRIVDVVLKTEGFASRRDYPPPPEFRHLQGLLTIQKVSTVTAATANGGGHFGDLTISKRPTAYVYGLKRDRRKLHIPLLHIPPEDYAAGGGSTGGVRSGAGRVDTKKPSSSTAGMGCSSNQSGSLLDF